MPDFKVRPTFEGGNLALSSELTAHIDDTSDAHDASAISYAGSAGVSATDVEAALDELDTEKVPATRAINTTSPLAGGGNLSADRTLSVAAASEAGAGVVELATAAETTAGSDNTRAVHPAGAKVELDKKLALAGGTMSGAITLAADPSSALHPATKQYVDAVRSGLDPKDSVRVATTANITLSGTQTIDDVAVIVGNRVLVKNQTTASENGIYVVAAGAWTRASDADSSAEVNAGMFAFAEEGTVNADTGWWITTNNPITLGTTALTFAQFAGPGAVQAGAGVLRSGNTFSADFGTTAGKAMEGNDSRVVNAVPNTRTISTTAPLSGGGDLSANRTLSVGAASDTATGVVELATSAETTTGTDTARATTPAGVKAVADTKAATSHATQHNPGGSDVIDRFETILFTLDGILPTANGTTTGTKRVPMSVAGTIVSVRATIDGNPVGAGSSQTLDLLKNATTMYAGTAKPSFTPGGSQNLNTGVPDTATFSAGDYLTVNLITAGSPSAGGSDLVWAVRYRF